MLEIGKFEGPRGLGVDVTVVFGANFETLDVGEDSEKRLSFLKRDRT